jgi:hypothetical protein
MVARLSISSWITASRLEESANDNQPTMSRLICLGQLQEFGKRTSYLGLKMSIEFLFRVFHLRIRQSFGKMGREEEKKEQA